MIRRQAFVSKAQLISEYLAGDQTFKGLEEKYGVNARTIQTWVRAYRKANGLTPTSSANETSDVKALKKRLKEAELKNELLEEMLRLSSKQTGIDLRKKFGSRQS